jgi:hypothetical protein
MAPIASDRWRYHPDRDALLAEAHARPSTPLIAPMLATRITTLSGEAGIEADRAHMAALCRRLGQPEPGPSSRWCVLDAGSWRLRWERHTEMSTWTLFRPAAGAGLFAESALDLVPADWLGAWPGEVLVAARLEVRPATNEGSPAAPFGVEAIGARLAEGVSLVGTDFRPDAQGMTRFLLLDGGAVAVGLGSAERDVVDPDGRAAGDEHRPARAEPAAAAAAAAKSVAAIGPLGAAVLQRQAAERRLRALVDVEDAGLITAVDRDVAPAVDGHVRVDEQIAAPAFQGGVQQDRPGAERVGEDDDVRAFRGSGEFQRFSQGQVCALDGSGVEFVVEGGDGDRGHDLGSDAGAIATKARHAGALGLASSAIARYGPAAFVRASLSLSSPSQTRWKISPERRGSSRGNGWASRHRRAGTIG